MSDLYWITVPPRNSWGYAHQVFGGYRISAVRTEEAFRYILSCADHGKIDGRKYLGVFDNAEDAKKLVMELLT